jgi:predicted dehydrogenase
MMVKKIGVVGCGKRIRYIVAKLNRQFPGKYYYYIYDIVEESMKLFEKEAGSDKVIICGSYEEILNNKGIDWVMIGSTNSAHKDHIVRALKSDKNIFCEKPIAMSINELEEIKNASRGKSKLKFIISYPLRYSPFYMKIKSIINSGKIGKIISMEFNEVLKFSHGGFFMSDWRRFNKDSGGYLLEKCCHDLDIVNWILGSIPKRVASFGGLNFFKEENKGILDEVVRNHRGEKEFDFDCNPFTSEKEIVDNQVAILEFLSGVRVSFHTNISSGLPERRLYICGTRGCVRGDLVSSKIEVKTIVDERKEVFVNESVVGGHGGGDEFLMKEFGDLIMDESRERNDLDDALKSAASILMIEKARKEERIVDLGLVWERLGYL